MSTDRTPAFRADPGDLQQWRARALRLIMLIGAVSGLPAWFSVIANAFLDNQLTPLLWVYTAGYGGFILLIFLPRTDVRVRAWVFLALSYAIAAASFGRVGLAGSGRLYLVFLPAVATILIGARAGYICIGISLLQYAGFAALARTGVLSLWITESGNPLRLSFWIEAGVALGVFLVTLTVLLERFTAKHIQTLSTSTRVALELEKAYGSLEQRMQDRTRELDLLNSVAAVASGLVDLREILRVSLEKTMDAFGIEAGGAYALDEETRTLVMLAHKGLSDEFVEKTARLDMVTALAGRELNLNLPLSWAVLDYPEGPLRQFIEAEGLKRVVGVPLAARGRIVGGLVLNTRKDRGISSEEESLLIAIGQQIGLAIENARLLEVERAQHAEAHRRQEVAEGLRETLAVLNSNSPLQRTLNFIISQACRLMQCDAASLFQLETPQGPLSIRASCGLRDGYVTGVRFSPGRGGAGQGPGAAEALHGAGRGAVRRRAGRGPGPRRAGRPRGAAADDGRRDTTPSSRCPWWCRTKDTAGSPTTTGSPAGSRTKRCSLPRASAYRRQWPSRTRGCVPRRNRPRPLPSATALRGTCTTR